MEITLSEVKKIFRDLITGSLSREAADKWAYSIIQKREAGDLTFSPTKDQERIWSGIMYLFGIDIRENPNTYLHSLDDIKDAYHNKLGDD